MKEFIDDLVLGLENGKDFVICTVVAAKGSSPRGIGAKMLVSKSFVRGTVGGGMVERASILESERLLDIKHSFYKDYILRKNDVEDLGMVCGGDVSIKFSYIEANKTNIKFFKDVKEVYDTDKEVSLLLSIKEGENKNFDFSLLDKKDFEDFENKIGKKCSAKLSVVDTNIGKYYVEKLFDNEIVYVFGGGHVSRALIPILSYVDFTSVVVEDREDFAKKEDFNGVKKTILVNAQDFDKAINITENDYICIMTRGHKLDTEATAFALKTKAKYIGVIGSKRKVSFMKSVLLDMGFTNEDLLRIKSPIGLDIKAETPKEIAISIVGELIEKRASFNGK